MANWKHRLDLTDLIAKLDDDASPRTILQCGKTLASRIREQLMGRFPDDEDNLDDIAMNAEEADDIEAWDDVMEDLYNWGDAGHQCWIET